MKIVLELPIEPLSTNKLYGNVFGQARRFVSTEGKKFKNDVNTLVRDIIINENLSEHVSNMSGKALVVSMEVGLPSWLLKDGKSLRRKDLDNTCKACLDSVFKCLAEFEEDIDDSQIWTLNLSKKVSLTPMTIITIQLLENTQL